MTPAIRADDLGKMYRVAHGAPQAGYRMLRDQITAALTAPFRRLVGNAPPSISYENFWALKEVSFEVPPGEVLGIIGRNGAGKSTLLKVMSRITKPTSGRCEINGRVGSLLEVGTGFHPELTGRENVYLNGSLLGMSRREINSKFNEIVAFAEVEQFLDTPVKRYSSGMYVRLAFAVAAHLEPEILIVDEVLAVGDASFQKKCLGKLNDVSRHGRTIFFVSHNMQAVAQLTHRCIVMHGGKIHFDGPTEKALSLYHEMNEIPSHRVHGCYTATEPAFKNRVYQATVKTSDAGAVHRFAAPVTFEFILDVVQPTNSLCFSFQVLSSTDMAMTHMWLLKDEQYRHEPGRYRLTCRVERLHLYMGSYTLTTYFSDRRSGEAHETLSGICPFDVTMIHEHREEYEWQGGAAVYLEDFVWEPVVRLGDPECAAG